MLVLFSPQDPAKAFAGFSRQAQHWSTSKGLATLVHVLWAARGSEEETWKYNATEVMLATLRSPPR